MAEHWQGQKTLYSWGNCSRLTFDLDLQSISHSGTTVSGSGKLRLNYRNSCGGTGYYGYRVTGTPTGGSSVTYDTWGNQPDGYHQDRNVTFSFYAAESATSGELSVPWSSQSGDSGTVKWTLSFSSAATGPSGCKVTYKSCTYNSVKIESKVSSWGSGYSGTPNLEQIVVGSSATASTWETVGRQVKQNATSSTSSEQSVTNSNSTAYSGGLSIKGATPFKVAAWASTNVGHASAFDNTTRYTPPAPLKTLTYSQSEGSTNVTVTLTATGDSSSVNSSNAVTTHYRYSTDGGATWKPSSTTWYSISGTATAWTAKSASFTCNYGASVKIKACQSYNGAYGGDQTVSFTATTGTAPNNLSSSITSSTYNTVTMSGSCNYGKPDSISGRSLTVGVNINGSSLANRREKNKQNVTNVSSVLIDNTNNTSNLGGDFTLKGMLPVYPYAWASNTVKSSSSIGSVYYLPPAPGALTYNRPDAQQSNFNISYTGNTANNISNYTASELKRTVRWSADGGTTWTTVDNNVQKALTDVTTFSATIPATQSILVEAWMTYRGKNSTVSSITIVNNDDPVYLYGSVNGETVEVKKLYASVFGESVRVKKLYASVNGVARKVFEDLS